MTAHLVGGQGHDPDDLTGSAIMCAIALVGIVAAVVLTLWVTA